MGRLNPLLIDALGHLARDPLRTNLYFQVISRLYEKDSILLTTAGDRLLELRVGDDFPS